ncbi:hypothetical protein [Sphingomonas albertensis]|uniref:Uncharacterized protein n=1 Tax=Sphingomonas albertensis TaxID=2762591 RepID=A0ABR7AP82_9SPHN|nr:hypothetical protein [Sphingomonas albertensis]MBC3942254.1 hypothetical protein [Sphingomonas albertensis]
MTRAKDLKHDDSVNDAVPQDASSQDRDVTPAEERARVRQARESVQDAIGKIIGEPLGERPDDDAATAEADADADRDGKDDARKPVSPPVKRGNHIDENGAD